MPLPLAPLTDTAGLLKATKAALGMSRVPKNPGIVLYFLHCWRSSSHPTQQSNSSTLRHPTQPGNSSTLRDPGDHPNSSTLRDGTQFLKAPCTTYLQGVLGVTIRHYKPYFDAFVVFDKNGDYNHLAGRMRTLKCWTPLADDLFSRCTFEIPVELHRTFYHSTEMAEHLQGTGRPFYHSTATSPHRRYHDNQALPKEDKRVIYKGCTDVDIVSCFSSIWWHEMGGRDCLLPNAWLLNPEFKDDLLELIMTTFGLESKEKAKVKRSTLFAERHRHSSGTGVEWWDNLHSHILEYVASQGTTCHELFTRHERRVIDRMVQAGAVALLMHDGIIFRQVDHVALRAAAGPHLLKIEQW